jgi:hypothetical protein
MTPVAFLANAIRMLEQAANAPDEPTSRAIIHAAYYSVYHFSAEKLGLDPTNNRTAGHAEVRNTIINVSAGDPTCRPAARVIKSLFRKRSISDYHLRKTVLAVEAKAAVAEARSVFLAAKITPTTV